MKTVIFPRELSALDGDRYIIADIRDSAAFEAGHICTAVNVSPDISEGIKALPTDKTVIVCSKNGNEGEIYAGRLREQGINALNLSGGYALWLALQIEGSSRSEDIERSIRKQFHRAIFSRFVKAINDYELVKPGDNIAVCISGGKDSMLMAKLFQELHRHGKFPFGLLFLVMDPGYSPENRRIIEGNARMMGIPVRIFETDIFGSVYNVKNNPCYLCARMRRGHLYSKAKELGCNKIALGHHFDDVIETILMGMIYGGQVQTMLPKLRSDNFEGMQLIRPMYLIRERDIKEWCSYNDLHFIQCACRFTENAGRLSETCTDSISVSKRMEIKNLISRLAKDNPQIEMNIFRSVENVNLKKIVSYKKDGAVHSFLDGYID